MLRVDKGNLLADFEAMNWIILASKLSALLAMIALSGVLSSAQKFIHNAFLSIDTSDNAWYSPVHWPIGMPYLSIIASNDIV